MRLDLAAATRPSISVVFGTRLVATIPVPAFPGETKISSTCGDWRSFQAVACSRPPEPTSRTRAPTRALLPLDRPRRLGGDVVDHPVDAGDFVDDAIGHPGEKFVRQAGPVGRHRVVRHDSTDGNGVAVGAVVALDADGFR